jgi:hypothetical protein
MRRSNRFPPGGKLDFGLNHVQVRTHNPALKIGRFSSTPLNEAHAMLWTRHKLGLVAPKLILPDHPIVLGKGPGEMMGAVVF